MAEIRFQHDISVLKIWQDTYLIRNRPIFWVCQKYFVIDKRTNRYERENAKLKCHVQCIVHGSYHWLIWTVETGRERY